MGGSSAVVEVAPAPRATGKKWRATFPDGGTVDFGARGYDDYTTHRDPYRMLRYLLRHGGLDAAQYAALRAAPAATAHRRAQALAAASRIEDWTAPRTAGFWARWLLWSEPSLARAARVARRKLGAPLRVVVAASSATASPPQSDDHHGARRRRRASSRTGSARKAAVLRSA